MSRLRDEIWEQPGLARGLLETATQRVRRVAASLLADPPGGLLIAARGTSDHAATYAKYLFEIRNRLTVALAAPSTFTLYRAAPRMKGFCVIGISQSGSSPDVVAVVDAGRSQGCPTVAITNDPDSDLAQAAEHVILLEAGPEKAIAATKTYTSTLLLLAMLSQELQPDPAFRAALAAVPEAVERALALEDQVMRVARVDSTRLAVLGRGFQLSTAEEIALKITETSYVTAEGQSVADFLHGPIAMVERGFPVLLLRAHGPATEGMDDLLAKLLERGADVVTFADRAASDATRSVVIETGLPEALTPIPFVVAGQVFAFHLARHRGVDPDQPRGLQKITLTR